MSDPVHTIVAAGAAVAAVLLLWGAAARLTKFVRRMVHFLDDWQGSEPRPGVPHRPGVMERLNDHSLRIASIEEQTRQLTPNGGAHLADRVAEIQRQIGRMPSAESIERIEARLGIVNLSHAAAQDPSTTHLTLRPERHPS